jgi:putative acyl-CoA dehydrogenase
VLRALARNPESADVLMSELRIAAGANRLFDNAVVELGSALREPAEADARRIAGKMALLLEASLMLRHAPSADSDLFCQSRLGAEPVATYGGSPGKADMDAIIARAMPAV